MTILLHITRKFDLGNVLPTLGNVVEKPIIPSITPIIPSIPEKPLSKDEQDLKLLEQ